ESALTLLERASVALAVLHSAGQVPAETAQTADAAIIGAVNLLLWSQEPLTDNMRRMAKDALERVTAQPVNPDYWRGLG
ncbi:hypothetical protein ACYTX7_10230, partial [Streptococcus pyogenes]